MKNSIIPLLLVVLLGIGGIFLITRDRNSVETPDLNEEDVEEENDNEVPTVSEVSIAILDNERSSDSDIERGCDLVAFTTREISPTTAPLTAAMEELFAISETEVDGYYNFIANTNDTLIFDKAEVVDGTARIYLNGELSGLAGVCDDPRAKIQIEETALQFSTVNDVEIYLNDELTELTPSQQ